MAKNTIYFLYKKIFKGLLDEEYAKRIERYGLNELTPPHKTPEWLKFLKKFVDPFSILLWTGAFLCLVLIIVQAATKHEKGVSMENVVLMSVLIIVNLLSGIYGYIQERKSSRILEKFKKMTSNVSRNTLNNVFSIS